MFDVATVSRSLMEPVVAVDTDGVIQFANERFCSIAQFDPDDVLGADLAVIEDLVETGFPVFREAIETIARGEVDQRRVELSMRHPAAAPVPRRLPAETRVTPIHEDGRRIGVLIVWRDITDRKQREQELERQNARLENFSSVVSHDLRNPLNVASGRLELAMEECDSEHLDAVARAHNRMDELIEGLLAESREGETTTEIVPVNLAATFADCWQHVDTEDATHVAVTDRVVRTEEGRLRQLFENLIRNAVEHGTSGRRPLSNRPTDHGTMEAAAPGDGGADPDHPTVTVTLGELDDGFFVEDDGPGIPEDARNRVFDSGYSTSDEGTGIGLVIVEDVAEANGWDVAVTEGANGGARFEFRGVEFERR